MTSRLCAETLGTAAADIALPAYDRRRVKPGIVHLGLGAFHRAHQAVYTDDALALEVDDWGIIGVSLRSAATAQQLQPQDGLYSVLSADSERRQMRVIAAVTSVLVAPQSPEAVVAAIADPAIHIVTLTITEKGYCVAPEGRSLNLGHPDIAQELLHPERARTAIGFLALGLRRRMEAGAGPLTIISCDNLAENSRVLRTVVTQYLQRTYPAVLDWLPQNVRFPCSMVDRIVPAMTAARREEQSVALGLRDEAAVSAEPFSQWIIEDDFAASRPAWEQVGVRFVDDILPFEAIKLGLLNASHSAIAYLGLLADKETVDAVMADAQLRNFIVDLMTEELMPRLSVPAGFDLGVYRAELVERFDNPWLAHRCAQIAMDGSEKIAQRWLPALQAAQSPRLVAALSLWCCVVLLTDCVLDDPCAEQLLKARQSTAPLAQRVEQAVACARVTPASITDFGDLVARLERNIDRYVRFGVRDLLNASRGVGEQ